MIISALIPESFKRSETIDEANAISFNSSNSFLASFNLFSISESSVIMSSVFDDDFIFKFSILETICLESEINRFLKICFVFFSEYNLFFSDSNFFNSEFLFSKFEFISDNSDKIDDKFFVISFSLCLIFSIIDSL